MNVPVVASCEKIYIKSKHDKVAKTQKRKKEKVQRIENMETTGRGKGGGWD